MKMYPSEEKAQNQARVCMEVDLSAVWPDILEREMSPNTYCIVRILRLFLSYPCVVLIFCSC